MAKWVVVFVLVLAALLGGLYFLFYLPQAEALDTARREASLCLQEASALRGRVSDLEGMLEELQQTSTELEAQIREKEEQLAALRQTQDELLGELEQEISEGQIQVQRLRDQLRVDLVDEILFDSGEAALKPAGMEVLKRVATILMKAEDKLLIVQGHTDNVPIVGRLAERYPTNWELSAARAVNVARFFQEQAGLDPERLSAAAFSEYRPRAGNDTREGRQKNRRIEIVLAPQLPVVPEPEEKK
jgi:chemotaxis protein MotB